MELKPSKLTFNLASYTVATKYKGLLLPAVFTLCAVVVLFLVGFKTFYNLPNIKSDISKAQSRLVILETKSKSLEGISGVSGVLDENIALALEALPEKDEISALLSEVQQISGEAGVKLSSLQYTGVAKALNLQEEQNVKASDIGESGLYVQAAVEGTYQQLVKFLELLENARRVVSFEFLHLSSVSKDDLTKLNMSLNITGYYLKPKVSAAASPDTPVKIDFRSSDLNKVLEELRSFKRYENIMVQSEVFIEGGTAPEE